MSRILSLHLCKAETTQLLTLHFLEQQIHDLANQRVELLSVVSEELGSGADPGNPDPEIPEKRSNVGGEAFFPTPPATSN